LTRSGGAGTVATIGTVPQGSRFKSGAAPATVTGDENRVRPLSLAMGRSGE